MRPHQSIFLSIGFVISVQFAYAWPPFWFGLNVEQLPDRSVPSATSPFNGAEVPVPLPDDLFGPPADTSPPFGTYSFVPQGVSVGALVDEQNRLVLFNTENSEVMRVLEMPYLDPPSELNEPAEVTFVPSPGRPGPDILVTQNGEAFLISGATSELVKRSVVLTEYRGRVVVSGGIQEGQPFFVFGTGSAVSNSEPMVVVTDAEFRELARFRPFEEGGEGFSIGGVAVLQQDELARIAVSAGIHGGPRVVVKNAEQVLSGMTDPPNQKSFFVHEPTQRGGVRIAAADLNADGLPDLITTAASGGGARVTQIDGSSLTRGTSVNSFLITSDKFPRDQFGIRAGFVVQSTTGDTSDVFILAEEIVRPHGKPGELPVFREGTPVYDVLRFNPQTCETRIGLIGFSS